MRIRIRCSPIWIAAVVLLAAHHSVQAQWTINDFDAAWDFEDSNNRLLDVTGNGHNLTLNNVGPNFISPPAGNNGYMPAAIGNTAANWFGDFGQTEVTPTNGGLQIPASAYTGGQYSFVAVVRATTDQDGNANGRHKTILDPTGNVRFQHRPDQQGGNDSNRYVIGGGGANESGHIQQNDWSILMFTRGGDGDNHAIHDNNSSAANQFTVEATNTSGDQPSTFLIGTQGGSSDAFHGQIAFAGFVNEELDAQQQADLLEFLNNGPPNTGGPGGGGGGVPEPASLAIWGLIGLGGLGVGVFRLRRKKK